MEKNNKLIHKKTDDNHDKNNNKHSKIDKIDNSVLSNSVSANRALSPILTHNGKKVKKKTNIADKLQKISTSSSTSNIEKLKEIAKKIPIENIRKNIPIDDISKNSKNVILTDNENVLENKGYDGDDDYIQDTDEFITEIEHTDLESAEIENKKIISVSKINYNDSSNKIDVNVIDNQDNSNNLNNNVNSGKNDNSGKSNDNDDNRYENEFEEMEIEENEEGALSGKFSKQKSVKKKSISELMEFESEKVNNKFVDSEKLEKAHSEKFEIEDNNNDHSNNDSHIGSDKSSDKNVNIIDNDNIGDSDVNNMTVIDNNVMIENSNNIDKLEIHNTNTDTDSNKKNDNDSTDHNSNDSNNNIDSNDTNNLNDITNSTKDTNSNSNTNSPKSTDSTRRRSFSERIISEILEVNSVVENPLVEGLGYEDAFKPRKSSLKVSERMGVSMCV